MSNAGKVSTDTLVQCYTEHRNIRKVAELLGINPSSVHERLRHLGIATPPSHRVPFTDTEKERLCREYLTHRDIETLDELAKAMGRDKTTIVGMARKLGLIKRNGAGKRKLRTSVWKYMDERQAGIIWDRFKQQRLGLGRFCKQQGFDDLGFSRTMQRFFGDEYEHVIETKTPKQSLYRIGRQLEYQVRDELKTFNYVTLRSPASKSVIDLAAIRKGEILFIQCKRAGTLGVREWNELYHLALSVGATPLLATKQDSGRGNLYWVLTGEKDGSKHRQPMRAWLPERESGLRLPTLFAPSAP